MQLILHIGQHKTGTSALQQFLHANAGAMLDRGILYPIEKSSRHDHGFLYPLVFPDEPLPRYEHFLVRGDVMKAHRLAHAAWQDVLRQVAMFDPETVVLSTEYLYKPLSVKAAENLRRLIDSQPFDPTVCVYIREPAAEYLSRVQQILKYSASFPAPGPRSCREELETYAQVPGVSFSVTGFDRKLMHSGDINVDFMKRFLPDGPQVSCSKKASGENTSMSAEAMAANQEFRAKNYPEHDDEVIHDHSYFLYLLQSHDRSVPGFVSPQLRPSVRALVRQRADEFLWLRDEHGLEFPDLPYDTISKQRTVSAKKYRKVSDICEVDDGRARELLHKTMVEFNSAAGVLRRLRSRTRAIISALRQR